MPGASDTGLCSANIALPSCPLAAGGAIESDSVPALTAAGAARVAAPKNALVLVSYALTGAPSALAKMDSGCVSASSGSCASDSVCVWESHTGDW